MFLLVLLSCGLMFTDSRLDYLTTLRYYASVVVAPVHWIADLPERATSTLGDSLRSRQTLQAENQALREQILMQRYELQLLSHLKAENARLSDLLNASSIVDEMVKRAQLTGEAPDPFVKRVLINRGSTEDVFVGQPVLDAYGLMGQVVEVEPHASWVLLVTDPQHSTPVQINRNGVRVIATGSQEYPNELEVHNLPVTADVQEGDLLITSGLGGRFPVGYPVAVINSVVHDPGQPFAIIRATPAAHLERSRNLLLVF